MNNWDLIGKAVLMRAGTRSVRARVIGASPELVLLRFDDPAFHELHMTCRPLYIGAFRAALVAEVA